MNKLILVYYIIINLVALWLYKKDKRLAKKHGIRIPERVLLGIAFFGGGAGAFLGMYLFRHKTKHLSFLLLVPCSVVLHIIIWWLILK